MNSYSDTQPLYLAFQRFGRAQLVQSRSLGQTREAAADAAAAIHMAISKR